MAMPMDESQVKTRARRSPTTRPVVPAVSQAATARKLEPTPDEFDELDFEAPTPILAPSRSRSNQEAQAQTEQKNRQERIKVLQEKRDKLVDRLDTGAAAIEKARAQGQDVSSWEDFWIALLRQYEEVCDALRETYVQ